MSVLYYSIISLFVSFMIGIMLNTKIKIAAFGAAISGLSYCVFIVLGSSAIGYFIGTLVLSLLSEAAAKIIKAPSTLFLIIGIYPLVPGSEIYRTIMQIIQADYYQAIRTGCGTFVNITLMSTAIAIVSIIFGKTSEERFEKQQASKACKVDLKF